MMQDTGYRGCILYLAFNLFSPYFFLIRKKIDKDVNIFGKILN